MDRKRTPGTLTAAAAIVIIIALCRYLRRDYYIAVRNCANCIGVM